MTAITASMKSLEKSPVASQEVITRSLGHTKVCEITHRLKELDSLIIEELQRHPKEVVMSKVATKVLPTGLKGMAFASVLASFFLLGPTQEQIESHKNLKKLLEERNSLKHELDGSKQVDLILDSGKSTLNLLDVITIIFLCRVVLGRY